VLLLGGALDVKKAGRELSRTGGLFSGIKNGFLASTSPKETGNPLFYTRGGALRPKKRLNAPKNTSFWVYSGISPKISKSPYCIIRQKYYTADYSYSFEDRSGVTMFFEHVNFRPGPSMRKKKKIFEADIL
jgi:hypothetical protein